MPLLRYSTAYALRAMLALLLLAGCAGDPSELRDGEGGVGSVQAALETACTDGVDGDLDGFIDCIDPDCSAAPACANIVPCDGTFYQLRTSVATISEVDTSTDPISFTDSYSLGSVHNGAGYNVLDGHWYAVRRSDFHVIRFDRTGTVTDLGLPVGMPSLIMHAGDIDDQGRYWFYHQVQPNTVYRVDLQSGLPLTVTPVVFAGTANQARDIAFRPQDGRFYGIHGGTMVTYDPETLTVSSEPYTGYSHPSTTWGAAWFDGDGFLYAQHNNTGDIIRVDVATRVAALIGSGPGSSSNDGMSCAQAAPNFEICANSVDDDGDGTTDELDCVTPRDSDGDGIANIFDLDDDNDGLPDVLEGAGDIDGDGIPNALDLDSDNDGIFDIVEAGHDEADTDGDGQLTPGVECVYDAADNGLCDALETSPDANDYDADSDGVGGDVAADTNGDGIQDTLQTCGDGRVTGTEQCDDGDLDDTNACANDCTGVSLLPDGSACTANAECANTCISNVCAPPAAVSGTCDASDSDDCAGAVECDSSGTCGGDGAGCATNQNGNCVNTCIADVCAPQAADGGTCDASDNVDCTGGSCTAGGVCGFTVATGELGCSAGGASCADPDAACVADRCVLQLNEGLCARDQDCEGTLGCGTGGLCGANTATCSTNADCINTCIGGVCADAAALSGTCDASDDADCAGAIECDSSGTCGGDGAGCATNQNGNCVNTCISDVCSPQAGDGGTCDSSDNVDCISNSCTVGGSCAFTVATGELGCSAGGASCADPDAACVADRCVLQLNEGLCARDQDCEGTLGCGTGGLCGANTATCSTNADCINTCIGGVCADAAALSGTCDASDDADCAGAIECDSSGTCGGDGAGCATNQNGNCVNTCISDVCAPQAGDGGACDSSDNVDCTSNSCTVGGSCAFTVATGETGCNTGGASCADPDAACVADTCVLQLGEGVCDGSEDCEGTLDCGTGGLCGANTATCSTNADCINTCIGGVCADAAALSGTCDASDDADCAGAIECDSSGTCGGDGAGCATNENGNCVNTCISDVCAPQAADGGTCDSSDNVDCTSNSCTVGGSCAFTVATGEMGCNTGGASCADPDAACVADTCVLQLGEGVCDGSEDCEGTLDCGTGGLCGANTATCSTNADCMNTCIGGVCADAAALSGTCDASDDADCAGAIECDSSGTCGGDGAGCATNENGNCVNTCISDVCAPQAGDGGACDSSDNVDCTGNSCSAGGICLFTVATGEMGCDTGGASCADPDAACVADTCVLQLGEGACARAQDCEGTLDCGTGGICGANSAVCTTNAECVNVCLGGVCKDPAPLGDACDANEDEDCAGTVECSSGGTCGGDDAGCATNVNGNCVNTCIADVCAPRAGDGGACDSSDNVDCISNSCTVAGMCAFTVATGEMGCDTGGASCADPDAACVADTCVLQLGEGVCDGSEDCEGTLDCGTGGICGANSAVCTSNAECVNVCLGGVCKDPAPLGDTCDASEDEDCAGTVECSSGGTCGGDDAGCATNVNGNCVNTCIADVCAPLAPGGGMCDATDSADCSGGNICDAAGICTYSIATGEMGCDATGAYCANADAACVADTCVLQLGESVCDGSEDCEGTLGCGTGGICGANTATCSSNDDCLNVCVGGLCQDAAPLGAPCDASESADCDGAVECSSSGTCGGDGAGCATNQNANCVNTCIADVCAPLSAAQSSCDAGDTDDCSAASAVCDATSNTCLFPITLGACTLDADCQDANAVCSGGTCQFPNGTGDCTDTTAAERCVSDMCDAGICNGPCGDGALDVGEACDEGASNGAYPAVCSVACRLNAGQSCTGSSECDSGLLCAGSLLCTADADGDGVADTDDVDDDNDGILDIDEGEGVDPSADSNSDGLADYADATAAGFVDDNMDGIDDRYDFDGDGIPNHLDLDADGDGIADITEAGGTDADRDGRVDGFEDLDSDGLDDDVAMAPLPLPNTDGEAGQDFLDLDSDGDGLTDAYEAGAADADGDGAPDVSAADGDQDGLWDALTGVGLALPITDTDGDDVPDYQSLDSDGDTVPDAVEGHLGVVAAGADTDGDGIDDAFDPDCVEATDCGGVVGVPAPAPNTDATGPVDFRDLDSDGDGILDAVECPVGVVCADTDMDGLPDFRSLDADGDGLPDADEGHDTDHDGVPEVMASGVDTDGDGLDDAFDPDCVDAADCGGVVGVPAPTPDLDMDMSPNFQDTDDDGDGITTVQEIADAAAYMGPATDPTDIDANDFRNWYDLDSDGDGTNDMAESAGDGDFNMDGVLDYLDPGFAPADSDGDGILDIIECEGRFPVDADCLDSDQDGAPDWADVDDDNDGILTAVEYAANDPEDGDPENDHDADNDGIMNHLDLDADNDGIPDLWENGYAETDANGDGMPDAMTDGDSDGLLAAFDENDGDASNTATLTAVTNTDGTGPADYLDLDADDDGLLDILEADGTDADGDGRVDDFMDMDLDGLGDAVDVSNGGALWPTPDTDGDEAYDFQDVDSDGDGVADFIEAYDANADGVSDATASAADLNGDGVDDGLAMMAPPQPDMDMDGMVDWRDTDDDGDGLLTLAEDVNGSSSWADDDTDGDGAPNYLDTDDDGDGLLTANEASDPNGNSLPDDARDSDEDGTPDYLDVDDDGDSVWTRFEGPDADGDGSPADAQDTDMDGTPDYLDIDDDGDMLDTIDEMPDPNGDGDPSDAVDTDGDGTPDYLSVDTTVTPPDITGGVSGGSCSAAAGGNPANGLWLLVMIGLVLRRRRR